jgi:hypothetical protein
MASKLIGGSVELLSTILETARWKPAVGLLFRYQKRKEYILDITLNLLNELWNCHLERPTVCLLSSRKSDRIADITFPVIE